MEAHRAVRRQGLDQWFSTFVRPRPGEFFFFFLNKRGARYRAAALRFRNTDLDNRLTDDGEVISLMRRPPFISKKNPGTHFC
jgi:hypothetical protein